MNKPVILSSIAAGAAGLSLLVSLGTATAVVAGEHNQPNKDGHGRFSAQANMQADQQGMMNQQDEGLDNQRQNQQGPDRQQNKTQDGINSNTDMQRKGPQGMQNDRIGNTAPQVNTSTGGSY